MAAHTTCPRSRAWGGDSAQSTRSSRQPRRPKQAPAPHQERRRMSVFRLQPLPEAVGETLRCLRARSNRRHSGLRSASGALSFADEQLAPLGVLRRNGSAGRSVRSRDRSVRRGCWPAALVDFDEHAPVDAIAAASTCQEALTQLCAALIVIAGLVDQLGTPRPLGGHDDLSRPSCATEHASGAPPDSSCRQL